MFIVRLGVKCPVPGKVAQGRVTPSLTEYFYRDHIYVRCDQGYKLMMVHLKFYSMFFNWNSVLLHCHFFYWSGWWGDRKLLCHVSKQRRVAPPTAWMPQYVSFKLREDITNLNVSIAKVWLIMNVLFIKYWKIFFLCYSYWLWRTWPSAEWGSSVPVWLPESVSFCCSVSLQWTILFSIWWQ